MDDFCGGTDNDAVAWDVEIDECVRGDENVISDVDAAYYSGIDAYLDIVADAWDSMVSSAWVADCGAFVHIDIFAKDCTVIDCYFTRVDKPESRADLCWRMDFNSRLAG